MEWHSLELDGPTPNKYRWCGLCDDVDFKLYIPRESVPEPPPKWIEVAVESRLRSELSDQSQIEAVVEFVQEQSQTVRYCPVGDQETWKIGEPYVPMSLLPRPWPQQLHVFVRWGE